MTVTYEDFLASKRTPRADAGWPCGPGDLPTSLFRFQRHITAWAVRKGRAAIWADTGLGKTRMQVTWAREVTARAGGRSLILAPLGVTEQTVREATSIGIEVAYVADQAAADASPAPIVISNYERLHLFDPARYAAVVLDESSILKAYSGATKRALVKAFTATPYRLACSATPAPNDLEELCNHADFLGVMSPAEMRSTFFIADSRGEFMRYRLKGHAQDAFYQWLASWAIACRTPADLGFPDEGYVLPSLHIRDHLIPAGWVAEGELFTTKLQGVTQRAQVRRETVDARLARAVEIVRAEPGEQWLIWCGTNPEADGAAAALADLGAVNVKGPDTPEVKAATLRAFADGELPVLVTKPTLAGYGLNFQSCARMVFLGLSDSYEQYYQAIRRCYRFGQRREVEAHIVLADVERVIVDNVRAKESRARSMTAGLVSAIAAENRNQLFAGTSKGDDFEPRRPLILPDWLSSEAS
jgi:hypothetical protein